MLISDYKINYNNDNSFVNFEHIINNDDICKYNNEIEKSNSISFVNTSVSFNRKFNYSTFKKINTSNQSTVPIHNLFKF